jgi:hypothetical protein
MDYTTLGDISLNVWWYKQDWGYLVDPIDYSSDYKLVALKRNKYKCIYLPFYYKKIKINFYSEFLIEKDPLFN